METNDRPKITEVFLFGFEHHWQKGRKKKNIGELGGKLVSKIISFNRVLCTGVKSDQSLSAQFGNKSLLSIIIFTISIWWFKIQNLW